MVNDIVNWFSSYPLLWLIAFVMKSEKTFFKCHPPTTQRKVKAEFIQNYLFVNCDLRFFKPHQYDQSGAIFVSSWWQITVQK